MNTGTLYVLDTVIQTFSELSDERWIRFSAALRQLTVAGLPICYVTMQQNPALFLKPEVMDMIGEDMLDVFPLSVRDGEILKRAAFPTPEELEVWLDTKLLPLNLEKEKEILALLETDKAEFQRCCRGNCCDSCDFVFEEDEE